MDPLTEGFIWRRDCHDTVRMPTMIGRQPARCATVRHPRHIFMAGEVMESANLEDAIMWGEKKQEDKIMNMANIAANLACILIDRTNPILISTPSSLRKLEAQAQLEALQRDIPIQDPSTKWIGGANHGAVPVATTIRTLSSTSIQNGLHMLDLFTDITCGGLRTVLEAGYVGPCYTSVEIDDTSRAIARNVLTSLQEEFHEQLPVEAIRGCD